MRSHREKAQTPKALALCRQISPSGKRIERLPVDNCGRDVVKLRSFSATAYASALTSKHSRQASRLPIPSFQHGQKKEERKRNEVEKKEEEK
jgi:hypothetical protein